MSKLASVSLALCFCLSAVPGTTGPEFHYVYRWHSPTSFQGGVFLEYQFVDGELTLLETEAYFAPIGEIVGQEYSGVPLAMTLVRASLQPDFTQVIHAKVPDDDHIRHVVIKISASLTISVFVLTPDGAARSSGQADVAIV